MSAPSAARKRSRTPEPRRIIAIGLSADARSKRAVAALNWRHAMSTRTRVLFRRFFIGAAVGAALAAPRARAVEPLRPVREVRIKTAGERDLSRLLDRVKKNKSLLDSEVRARKLSADEANRIRKDLVSLEKRARALSKKSRVHFERGVRSLDMELDEIGQKIRT